MFLSIAGNLKIKGAKHRGEITGDQETHFSQEEELTHAHHDAREARVVLVCGARNPRVICTSELLPLSGPPCCQWMPLFLLALLCVGAS